MKLRDKKTGEIWNLRCYNEGSNDTIFVSNGFQNYDINSIKQRADTFEYVEPKEYWYIDWTPEIGVYHTIDVASDADERQKEIGNYFETKEEAEKAVEKLKAWKRLKELGFRFIGETCEYKSDKHFGSVFFETNGYALDVYEDTIELYDDLDLLFGGEE